MHCYFGHTEVGGGKELFRLGNTHIIEVFAETVLCYFFEYPGKIAVADIAHCRGVGGCDFIAEMCGNIIHCALYLYHQVIAYACVKLQVNVFAVPIAQNP